MRASESGISVAHGIGARPSNITDWKRSEAKMQEAAATMKSRRNCVRMQMVMQTEELLITWIQNKCEENISLSNLLFQLKAKKMYNSIESEKFSSAKCLPFVASYTGLLRFKKCNSHCFALM